LVIFQETYFLLTDRQDLTTFQIILLYAYRWQVEIYQPYNLCNTLKLMKRIILAVAKYGGLSVGPAIAQFLRHRPGSTTGEASYWCRAVP